jgi:hypothetical protein
MMELPSILLIVHYSIEPTIIEFCDISSILLFKTDPFI